MTNLGRSKEAAAIANGTAIVITHIAIGDGATVPSGGETALYHEITRKSVSGHGTVTGAANVAYFDIFLEAAEGPYTIREAGLIDQDGDLIAIARYDPPINKPTPASGQTVEGTVRLEVAFSNIANVTIVVDPSFKVQMQRLSRLPWVPVISMTVTAPPATPSVGDLYLVPSGAIGAWTGQAGKIAEYTSAGWGIISPPDGHGISLPDGRVFERVNGIYIEKLALDTQSGKWLYGVSAGTANALTVALTPVPQALVAGQVLRIKVSATNTAAATLNVNGLGAKPIVRVDDGALIESDLTAGDVIEIVYTGTQWRLLSFCRSLLPKPLTQTQIFYIRPDGNDNNTGLENTPASAFKTLQGAWGAVSSRYMPSDKYAIEFRLAPGAYEGVTFGGYTGVVKVVGAAATRSQYVIKEPAGQTFAISASNGHVIVEGVTIQSVTAAGIETLLVWADGAGKITLRDTRFVCPANNPALTLIYLGGGGKVDVRGSIDVFGVDGAGSTINSVVRAEQGAVFSGGLYAYPVVWAVYNIKVSNSWAVSNSLSPQSWVGVTFSKAGSIFTGRRYYIDGNAVVQTAGAGPNFFPGDIAGVVASGGQYL